MLTIELDQNGKKWTENIFVIDAHSHLGQDEDGATMMNPLAPGSGTFDFWSKIQGRIVEDWNEGEPQSFNTYINGIPTHLRLDFKPFPFTNQLLIALKKRGKKHSDLKDKLQFNSLIDQATVFPFQDIFRFKQPEAQYRASNINISRFTTRFPFSLKLIGYCRVDPMEGEKAVNEVKYAREVLGLQGLKLHPRSEGWVDEASTEKPSPVLIEAAKYSMPIIFDTRGKRTILDIGKLVERTRNIIKQKYPQLLPHFKVIIAHFAQGNVGDYDVYNTVVQPNTYGDLSMLHGEGAANFFEDFRQWFKNNNRKSIDGREWSEYLLFATDYPYFGDIHAEKLLIYTFNKAFFDNGGTIQDTKNILGLNQLRLLPEYNNSFVNHSKPLKPSILISNPRYNENKQTTRELFISSLADLLISNKIDIKNLIMEFKKNWSSLSENQILIITNPQNKKLEIPLYSLEIIKNEVTLLASLSSCEMWNKFGMNYFDPKYRQYLSQYLTNSNLTYDNKNITEIVKTILS